MVNPKYPMITKYVVNNPCYKDNVQINVTSLVLHSIGCSQPSALNMWNRWSKPTARNCVSAVCDDHECYIMLPCEEKVGKATKNWGVGKGSSGYSNNTCSVQIEMCESKYNEYVTSSSIQLKKGYEKEAVEYTSKCLDVAIEFLAQMAYFHKIDVLGKDKRGNPTLMSHYECYLHKTGTAHIDVSHLEKAYKSYLDMSMDTIRKRVAERVNEIRIEQEVSNMTQQEFDTYLSKASPTVIDQIMSTYFQRLAKLPASAYAEPALQWAKESGLMVGGPSGNQMPQDKISRQDVVTVLKRYHENFVQTKRQ